MSGIFSGNTIVRRQTATRKKRKRSEWRAFSLHGEVFGEGMCARSGGKLKLIWISRNRLGYLYIRVGSIYS